MRIRFDRQPRTSRRRFVAGAGAASGLLAITGLPLRAFAQGAAPAIVTADSQRVHLPSGVQVGDLKDGAAIVWARADRPARMVVEWATTESFQDARRVPGPAALEDTDYTAKLDIADLPPGQRIFYRVAFTDLADLKSTSEPVVGSFATPPAGRANVRFVWSGDTAGQGWGIDPDFGGMRIYETMRQVEPAFFIHSGDTIYADGPIEAEPSLPETLTEWPGGHVWKNVATEAKSKVAETLDEFRGNYAYNLMDEHVRRFNAAVPMFAQWDDHEVTNNWYPTEILGDDQAKGAYKERNVALLAARGARAFMDYMPVRPHPLERERLYTNFRYGPSLEIFRIDMRTYRGPNTLNNHAQEGPETVFFGADQRRWLKQALLASDATWKVIASDMPIGLVVPDGKTGNFENMANGDGPALGRELEIADLLRFIKHNGIKNAVWLTADVHYTAAHRFDPNRAQFQDFEPFWEFVSGPLNSGTFGPNDLDNTFGPEVVYVKAPEAGQANLPPSAGMQFFGQVDIDGASEVMTVTLKDMAGASLFTQELRPSA